MPTSEKYLPKYPIYILSKGRWNYNHTAKALDKLGIPYRIAVEPQEYDLYRQNFESEQLLTLPFSNHGKGSGPARNWCWEHSIREGHERGNLPRSIYKIDIFYIFILCIFFYQSSIDRFFF